MTNGNETTDYVRFTENSVKPQERYEFVENEDYISFHKKWSEGLVVRYALSTLFAFHKK